MESSVITVTLNLIYDPPYFVTKLQNQTAYVGHRKEYVLPVAQNNRRNFTTIKYIGIVSQITVTSNKSAIFNFPYSMGPGFYQIYLNLSAENNEITDTFNLKLVNEPPYFVSNLTNQTVWDCSFLSYTFPNRIDPEGNYIPVNFTYNISTYLSYNEYTSTVYFVPPCNLSQPYYENVTFNLSDGFHNVSFSFQIMAKNIPASKKPTGAQMLELKKMVDILTSSIPPGNIKVAPIGTKVPQIDPRKQPLSNSLIIPFPEFEYSGEPFNRIPDTRLKVGEVVKGGVPKLKSPIKGMSLDYELVMIPEKKLLKRRGRNWAFEPEVGDEGLYNFTLYIIMNMAGQPTQKLKYNFKVTVWNDLPIEDQNYKISEDEILLYKRAQRINP